MCHLQNIAMHDFQKVWLLDRQTDGQTDAGQSDPYVPLCFAGDTKTNFGPVLLPIKPLHWTPPLTNLRGGEDPDPLPMLQMEAHAQFYRDKNMLGMLQGTE